MIAYGAQIPDGVSYMAKKERIIVKRNDDLDAIDQELEEAMNRLSGTNEQIAHLLESIDHSIQPSGDDEPSEDGSGETGSEETRTENAGGESPAASE